MITRPGHMVTYVSTKESDVRLSHTSYGELLEAIQSLKPNGYVVSINQSLLRITEETYPQINRHRNIGVLFRLPVYETIPPNTQQVG